MKLHKWNILAVASFLGAAILPTTNLSNTQSQLANSNNFIADNDLEKSVYLVELPNAWIQIQYSRGNEIIPASNWNGLKDIVYNKYWRFSDHDNLKKLELNKDYNFKLTVDNEADTLVTINLKIDKQNRLLFKYSYDVKYFGTKNHSSDNDYKIKIQIDTGDKVKLLDDNNKCIITDNINLYDPFSYYNDILDTERQLTQHKTLIDFSNIKIFKKTYEIPVNFKVSEDWTNYQHENDYSVPIESGPTIKTLFKWTDYAKTWDEFKKLNPKIYTKNEFAEFQIKNWKEELGKTEQNNYKNIIRAKDILEKNIENISPTDLWTNDGTQDGRYDKAIIFESSAIVRVNGLERSITSRSYLFKDGDFIKMKTIFHLVNLNSFPVAYRIDGKLKGHSHTTLSIPTIVLEDTN